MPTTTKSSKEPRSTHLAAVPDRQGGSPGRTASEIRLWDAVDSHPGTSAAELAGHAEVGRSTATKILARWHEHGLVARHAGGISNGRRTPDTWTTVDRPDPAGQEQPHKVESANGRQRLARGALSGIVEDFLREPGREALELSPGEIGRKLGRSPGAVSNCLDKLEAHGTVVLTSKKPRRYRLSDQASGD